MLVLTLSCSVLFLCLIVIAQGYIHFITAKKLSRVQEARIDDIKLYSTATLKVQDDTVQMLKDVNRLVETIEKRRPKC